MKSAGAWRAMFVIGVSALFAVATPFAHADLIVSKIVYDPAGSNARHQWIEIANTGPSAIDLSAKNIRLFDASGNHLIKPYAGGSSVLGAGEVAVIAQNPLTFLSDYSGYAGLLLKSAFVLPASAGFVGIIQTDGTVLARASYVAPAPTVSSTAQKSKMKQNASGRSTNSSGTNIESKGRQSSTNITSNKYGKGTVAPPTSAGAEVGGALPAFAFPTISFPGLAPFEPLFSSVWFASFLGLLAFSTFSLILIQRTTHL